MRRTAPAAAASVRNGWPWLLVALVALVGAAAVGFIVTSGPNAGPEPSGAPLAPRPESVPRASSPLATAEPARSPGSGIGSSPGSWADVARGFGRTFTHTALGQEAWFAAMSSWLTDEQAEMYRNVPIEDIPTGTLQNVDVDDPGHAHQTRGLLTYDTGMVLEVGLTYVERAGGWLVASVALAGPRG